MASEIKPVQKTFRKRLLSLHPYAHWFVYASAILATLTPILAVEVSFGLCFQSKVLNYLLLGPFIPLPVIQFPVAFWLFWPLFLFSAILEIAYWQEKIRDQSFKWYHFPKLIFIVLLMLWSSALAFDFALIPFTRGGLGSAIQFVLVLYERIFH